MNVLSTAHRLSGAITVPGSKSHTIRAGILASLGSGTSYIRNPLESADCLSCLDVIEAFGACVRREKGLWTVTAPEGGLRLPARVIDAQNSGSVLYFMSAIAATLPGWTVMTGDESLCTRPIDTLLQAIRDLGGKGFTTRPGIDAPPAVIGGPFVAGTVELEGHLSQPVSGLMMAAARISGTTVIRLRDPKETPFLKMTADWLASLGVHVSYDPERLDRFEISGPQAFSSFDRVIPSDWEGVAFPLVAAVITGSEISILDVDCSGSQGDEAIVAVLSAMGAKVSLDRQTGILSVHAPESGRSLRGGTFALADFPDALPALSVAACFAEGDTTFTDIGVCRLKETDRVAVMNRELTLLGADVEEGPDWLTVHGKGGKALHGAVVNSHDDHRVAMALSVAGLAIEGPGVTVLDGECCAVTFPDFYGVMNGIGAGFVCQE